MRHTSHGGATPPTPPRPTVATLRATGIMACVPEVQLADLVELATWQTFKSGAVIVRQHEQSRTVYVVVAGYVKVMRGGELAAPMVALDPQHPQADRRTHPRLPVMLSLLGPGDLLGEVAALLNSSRSASIVALTPSELVGLPHDEFLRCLHRNPALALAVMRKMAQRLVEANQHIELWRGDLTGRVHALLRQCQSIGLDTERWLSNAEIARMVGATRAAVSPIMGRIRPHQSTPTRTPA